MFNLFNCLIPDHHRLKICVNLKSEYFQETCNVEKQEKDDNTCSIKIDFEIKEDEVSEEDAVEREPEREEPI